MPRLLISAAHTLENPGEIFGDLREADITREILRKTIPYLEYLNIDFQAVPLDLQLLKRLDWIRDTGYSKEQGDIFVEIHVNDGGKRGIEGWYEGGANPDNNSQKLTETLVNGICQKTGYQNQGAKSEYEHELGSLIILNQSNTISTAIECLYIDNPDDIAILKDDSKLSSLAKAIAESINDYLKNVAPTLKYSTGFKPLPSNTINQPVFQRSTTPTLGSPFNQSLPSMGNTTQNRPVLMDREERKEMIKKVFLKVLGKEPNQNDLNFHLNTGVAENELIKKLVEGQDHEKILSDAKAYKESSEKLIRLENEVAQLKANQTDFKAMQDSTNRLLEHKNMLIARLHQELAKNNIIVHGSHIDSAFNQPKASNNNFYPTPKKKRTFLDFLMDIFRL